MFDLRVSSFKTIQIEEDKSLIIYFLADRNMVPGGRNGDTLDRLNIIRKFNKLHLILIRINEFFDNGLASSVDELQFLLLFDKTDGVFEVEVAIRAKHIVNIQIDSLLMSFHFKYFL